MTLRGKSSLTVVVVFVVAGCAGRARPSGRPSLAPNDSAVFATTLRAVIESAVAFGAGRDLRADAWPLVPEFDIFDARGVRFVDVSRTTVEMRRAIMRQLGVTDTNALAPQTGRCGSAGQALQREVGGDTARQPGCPPKSVTIATLSYARRVLTYPGSQLTAKPYTGEPSSNPGVGYWVVRVIVTYATPQFSGTDAWDYLLQFRAGEFVFIRKEPIASSG